jgi:putative transcriptional regulator
VLLGAALAASLLAGAAPPVVPPSARHLKPGVFLYAAPGLTSPSFTESVVLLVRHEAEGSLGLIVNRPTKIAIREALRDKDERRELGQALHYGGPVDAEAVLALVRSAKRMDEATRVLPDVYLTTDAAVIKKIAREPEAEGRLRVYAGYSGWGRGQLESELKLGAWVIAPADARSIFTDDATSLWPRVYDLMGRIEARAR